MLVPVLWAAAFMTVAFATFMLTVRSHVQVATAEAAALDAGAAAEAGINLAIADIVNGQWVRGWRQRFPADGRHRACRLGRATVTVTVSDEAGRVDLNAAGEELLAALVAGLGEPVERARRLAAAIADWRDADSERRPEGAEASDYREAKRSGPRNAPLEAPEELAQVLDMEATLIARLKPFATLHAGSETIDPAAAPAGLMEVLARGFAVLGQSRVPARYLAPTTRRLFRIQADAEGERGGRLVREAVIRAVPGRGRPFTMLAWRREGVPALKPATAATAPIDVGPC